jgi:hypothetical protein
MRGFTGYILSILCLVWSTRIQADRVFDGDSSDIWVGEGIAINSYLNDAPLSPLAYYVLDADITTQSIIWKEFDLLVAHLAKRKERYNNDEQFLKVLFNKTRNRYLHHYSELSSFSELFQTKNYNCLSATMLYALLLDHFEYEYRIIENTYHIYLMVDLGGMSILLETTDPEYGFVADVEEIHSRLNAYAQEQLKRRTYNFQHSTNEDIDLYQLVGLQYYNKAIQSYNQNDYKKALHAMNKGLVFYRSDRMLEMFMLIRLQLRQKKDTYLAID